VKTIEQPPEVNPPNAGEAAPLAANGDALRTRSLAVSGLFVLALFYTLYFAGPFLFPIVVAALLAFVLRPVVRGLKNLRIPEPVGAALVVTVVVAATVFAVVSLSTPAARWMEKIEHRLRDLLAPVAEVGEATAKVEELTEVPPPRGAERTEVEIKGPDLERRLLTNAWEFGAGLVVMLTLLFFLLASGDLFLRKLVHILPRLRDKILAVEIAHRIEADVSHYLFVVSLLNAGFGLVVGLAMALLGMPNPALWGVLAGVTNFIPYLGGLACTVVLGLVALFTFGTLERALLVVGVFAALNFLESHFITPAVVGRRLELNPVAVFVGLLFWGWTWGIGGALIAVPLLATAKIICDHVERLRPVGEFLGR
jgi:predicted PurR-regulated permease PerM